MHHHSAMLTELTTSDAAFHELVAASHQRFARLVQEAEEKATVFYQKTLGHPARIEEVVDEVFAAVEREGDAAVVRYSQAFDGSALIPEKLRVTPAELAAAYSACDPTLRAAMHTAIEQVTTYQRRLLPRGFGEALDEPLGVRWTAIPRVGAYVPGGPAGTLPLFSSVIMNLVPAKVAGVPSTVLVTPPRADGSVAPELLAAAYAVGVDEVYKVGGIPAIAALACGTPTIAKADKIVGPGNIVVTLAKRRAYGRVDIDMLAGPSEILVIADGSVDPRFVAADLLSQAEHDTLAMCICVCLPAAAAAIQTEVRRQLDALPAERQRVARASVERLGRLVRVDTLAEAVEVANRVAAEHLEVLIADPQALVPQLTNAGAIFIGPWSPEPMGDYVAGPSHTLPTGGTARMWSGIGADTFLKRTSLINLDEATFRRLAPAGLALARGEGLEAHARSIAIRLG
jgi:histidinol dehydrogenase